MKEMMIDKFKNFNEQQKKRSIINILLVVVVGSGMKYTYNIGGKTYAAKFNFPWFLNDSKGMGMTTIRMLHDFQTSDKDGVKNRSGADCIIGPMTIQQLFKRANIDM